MFLLLDSKTKLEFIDKSYITDFVEVDLKEAYFLARTGISTNEKSISSYIKFKEKLGGDFDWNSIRAAQSHLKFDDNNEIKISITSVTKINNNIQLSIATVMLVVGIIGMLMSSSFKDVDGIEKALIMIMIFFGSLIFGVLILRSNTSYSIVKRMERKLNE